MKQAQTYQPARHWLDSWHVDPSANRTYDFIDGLRGVAILMVLACHLIYAHEPNSPAGRFLLHFSNSMGKGVNLFFTLSGFLIAWPFWKRKVNQSTQLVPPGYGWRRFWKIYPPLALSILVLTPLFIWSEGDAPVFIRTAIEWLTGVAFLMPVSGKLNPVMWSLVVEIHFYLVLPMLFLLTRRLSAKTCLWAISAFLFVVPVSIQAITGKYPVLYPEIKDPFCTGLSCFCFGVAVAGIDALKLWNKGWSKIAVAGWPVMVIGLAGWTWAGLEPAQNAAIILHLSHWIFLLGTGCLLCYAANPDHVHARWLCAPWLRWCGVISYEWYLFHQPIIYWARTLFGPAQGNVAKYLLIIGLPVLVSVTFSALVYRLFSLPILKFGRQTRVAAK